MGAPIGGRTGGGQLAIAIALVIAASLVPGLLGLGYWAGVMHLAVLYVVASSMTGLLLVDAGQVSLGHGAIFGAAAYAVGVACGLHGLSYGLGALLGVAAALGVGVLFALPSLRVQGFYLGFVTLSAALVMPDALFAFDRYTGGLNGITVDLRWIRHDLGGGISPLSLAVATLGSLALAGAAGLRRTALGRRMRVAGADADAARTLGISPGAARFTAFLLSAAVTGLAGILYPAVVGFLSPNAFRLDLSILFFFAVIVGGKGQPLGTLVGVAILYLLPNVILARFVEYRTLIYGVLSLLIMLLMPMGVVGSIAAWTRRGRPAAMLGPLHLEDAARTGRGVETSTSPAPVIRVRGARKAFGRAVALDGIDLDVRAGEIHGLVGANGSGKTSLLNVLTGLGRIDRGEVAIRGRDASRASARALSAAGVGRTFQTPRIFEELGAWDNLQIGLDGRLGRTSGVLGEAFIADLRRRLDPLETGSIPHGQRRLLEVIRLLLHDCDILLLDEPAAGLSPSERGGLSRLLRDLRDRLGLTIVLVEHDLALVWSVADRVSVLEAGRVVATGDPDAVARDAGARHLFASRADA